MMKKRLIFPTLLRLYCLSAIVSWLSPVIAASPLIRCVRNFNGHAANAVGDNYNIAAQNIDSISTQDTDSISVPQLDEVVVKGTLRAEKGDTLSVIPSANQRKFSMNGFELLRSLMLPELRINTVKGEISLANGEKVQIMIDGKPVERQAVIALRPKEVTRIEYIQNLGAEYGYDTSIGAVIDIIKKKRTDGYAAAALLNNTVTTVNCHNFAFGKYTKGNSEYGISFDSEYASVTRRRIDNNNVYHMNDNIDKLVLFKGLNTPLKYSQNTLQLMYNNYVPEKHIVDITFEGMFYYSPDRAHAQKVTEDATDLYYQLTRPYEKYVSPHLNIYYKRFFSKNSSITANIAGNYRHTDYRHNIFESATDKFDYNDPSYSYGTVSDRQSYIGEIKYQNKFNRKFSLNVGARGSYSYTSNDYITKSSSTDRLHDTHIYAYSSTSGYIGAFFYSAGIGLSGRIMDQNDRHMNKWIFRPELQASYRICGWRFNLRGVILQTSPTLSELVDTEFRINRFEKKMGNPELTDWRKYRTSLKITKTLGPVALQNTLSYTIDHNPVMPFTERVTDNGETLFITSFKNQRRMSVLTDNLTLDMELNDNLSFSAGVNYNSYQARSNYYSHHLDNWQFNLTADWYSGHWNVGINWVSPEKSLFGESYSYTGATNTLYVNYIVGDRWRFGLTGQYLLCKNGPTFKEDLASRYMHKNEITVVPAYANMIIATIAWNFSAGRQRKKAKIDMENTDYESGVFK